MANEHYLTERARYEAALQNRNVRAMLDAIAKAEGTFGRGDNGYNINVGGRTFNNNYARHPEIMVQLSPGLRSNAAGRYQYLSTTWKPLARRLGLNDFSPRNQDIGAVALIADANALNDVMRGDIQTAAHKLRGIWASLPGSPYGQPTLSTNRFMQGFRDALAAIGRGINTVFSAIGNTFRPAEPQPQLQPQLQPTPPQPSGFQINRQFDGPPQTPSGYAPPYGAQNAPPRDAVRPVIAQPPTHSLVNNPASPARSESNVIMGDSIGVSMRSAYPNKQNVAVGGVSIAAAASQFRNVRAGAVADVVLGSNNGTYPDAENRRQVQKFLDAADRAGVRINNWVLPGNYERHPQGDAGLARVANVISDTIQEYNRAHPDRAPIQPIVTRDRGIQKEPDGLHLTAAGTQQVRTLIANAAPPAPAQTTVTATTHRFVIHTQTPPRNPA